MAFCGDEAKLRYQADAKLIGEFAQIKIQRLDRKSVSADGFQEIKAATTDMMWPDQEVKNGPGYCGGRQVDFKGLSKKKYQDKFAHQNFTISAQHADQTVEAANTEIIDELPAAGPDTKSIGIPMPTEMWQPNWGLNPATNAPVFLGYMQTMSDPTGTQWQPSNMNCGKFDIEHRDGVVFITVQVSLVTTTGKAPGSVFRYFKKRVENYWNSHSSGYNRWLYHRTGCRRGDDCLCSVVGNSKGDYVSTGCCKVPFKVVIVDGGGNANVVRLHYLNPVQRVQAALNLDGWGAKKLAVPVDTGNVYYPENRPNTYAHEVGHMMGFPDQYPNGVVVPGAMNAAGPTGAGMFPIDDSSIMGMNQTEVKKIHTAAHWFDDWINSNIDSMKPIP